MAGTVPADQIAALAITLTTSPSDVQAERVPNNKHRQTFVTYSARPGGNVKNQRPDHTRDITQAPKLRRKFTQNRLTNRRMRGERAQGYGLSIHVMISMQRQAPIRETPFKRLTVSSQVIGRVIYAAGV